MWLLDSKCTFGNSRGLKHNRIRKGRHHHDRSWWGQVGGDTFSSISINLVASIGCNKNSEEHNIEIKSIMWFQNLLVRDHQQAASIEVRNKQDEGWKTLEIVNESQHKASTWPRCTMNSQENMVASHELSSENVKRHSKELPSPAFTLP